MTSDAGGRSVATLDGRIFPIALDQELLVRGKPALVRQARDAEPTDPGKLGQVFWRPSTPMGMSRESDSGQLETDYARNVDIHWDNLLTGPPEGHDVDLTVKDPSASSLVLGFFLGQKLGIASPAASATRVVDDRGSIFVARGLYDTQIEPTAMAVVNTAIMPAPIEDSDIWQGEGYLALGGGAPMQRRKAVSPTAALYEDVHAIDPAGIVYAHQVQPSAGILCFISAMPNENNQARFTVDAFESLSNPFPVVDDITELVTGIGLLGPYYFFGTNKGVYATTEQGQPVAFIKSLRLSPSEFNGANMVEAWGWLYAGSVLGLYALKHDGSYSRVGPERETGFEGPVGGTVTAMNLMPNDEILVAFLNPWGDVDIVRNVFHARGAPTTYDVPKWTPYSGVADLFPFITLPAGDCEVIAATGLRDEPTWIIGNGTNIRYFESAFFGRDIITPDYRFGAVQGDWYGSTLMRQPGLRKYARYWRFELEHADEGNYFRLETLVDDDVAGLGWQEIAHVTESGLATVYPQGAGLPLKGQGFHRIKPHLERNANRTTNPVQLRGPLELVYVERPDKVDGLEMTVVLGAHGYSVDSDYAYLLELCGDRTEPVRFKLPGDRGFVQGFLEDVKRVYVASPGVVAAQLVGVLWKAS